MKNMNFIVAVFVLVLSAVSAQSQLQWVTVNHQWTQAINGRQACSIGSQCPEFWLTDFPAAPGFPDAKNYNLPSWMPQKIFIVYAGARFDGIGAVNGQIAWSIDYDRRCYNTGVPPLHQAGSFYSGFCDLSADSLLVSLANGETEKWRSFSPLAPKLLDRSKDSIWLQSDSVGAGYASIHLGFIIPATTQPTGLLVPPPPPLGQWTFVVGPIPGNNGFANYTGYTFATFIEAAPPPLVGGLQTRVTFMGQQGTSIAAAAVGPRVSGALTAQSMTPLKFGGSSSTFIGANGTVLSDPIPVGVDGTGGFVVKGAIVSGSLNYQVGQGGFRTFYVLGNDTLNLGVGGYVEGASVVGVKSIEKLF